MPHRTRRPCNASMAKLDHPLADVRAELERLAASHGFNPSMTPTGIEITRTGFRLCRFSHVGTHVPIPGIPEVNADRIIRNRLGRLPELPYRDTRKQLSFALLARARSTRFDPGGRPTGPLFLGDHAYLYIDEGIGCVRPFVVEEVPPISVAEFMGDVVAA